LKIFNKDLKILKDESDIRQFSKDSLEIKKEELMNGKEFKE